MAKKQQKNLSYLWVTALYAVIVVLSLLMCTVGMVRWLRDGRTDLLGPGTVALIVSLGLIPIAYALLKFVGQRGIDRISDMLVLLHSINDRLIMTDMAKQVTFRRRDLDMVRKAIRDSIRYEDFDEALVLCKQMDRTLGRRREAHEIRHQILTAREARQENQLGRAITEFEQLLNAHEFVKASAHAGEIQRRYPDSEQVKGLNRRVTEAKDRHKRVLEREFLEAAERDDIDTAMDLLKDLDKYLTQRDAAPLVETARGVIGRKRRMLGIQFKQAVQDQSWAQAIDIGEQIVSEFPNSRMAQEVRSRLDLLHANMSDRFVTAHTGEPTA